jgi:hypothetical protein
MENRIYCGEFHHKKQLEDMHLVQFSVFAGLEKAYVYKQIYMYSKFSMLLTHTGVVLTA